MQHISVDKINTFTGHRDCIYTISEASEPECFYTASGDGMVVKWNIKNGDNGELVAKTDNSIYSLAFIPDRNLLIVGENFIGIQIIDTISNQHLKSLKLTDAAIFDIKIHLSQIWIACGDGNVIILNTETYEIINILKLSSQSARCITFQENEAYIGFSDNFIRAIDTFNFEVINEFQNHSNSVFTIQTNDNQLFSAGRDAHLKIINLKDNSIQNDIVAHMFAINHICFSPDKKYFATCSMDKSIKVWETSSQRLLKVIDKSRHAGHGTSINKLMWTTFENLLISVSDDRSISIWKLDIKIKNLK